MDWWRGDPPAPGAQSVDLISLWRVRQVLQPQAPLPSWSLVGDEPCCSAQPELLIGFQPFVTIFFEPTSLLLVAYLEDMLRLVYPKVGTTVST